MNYYNEWDPQAATWLRELITRELIPYGYVDERSITEVTPGDLEGFTQCHFFAGIGGWSLALQLAGVPASTRLWTGSPPCQPFSVAGKSLGFDDPRHLAPTLLRLVRECKPQYFFGEQVAAAIGKHWLDFVFLNLEEQNYACGAAVLPACSVGAPHKRDRLFFGARLVVHTNSQQIPATGHEAGPAISGGSGAALSQLADHGMQQRPIAVSGSDTCRSLPGGRIETSISPAGCSGFVNMADTNDARPQGRVTMSECGIKLPAGSCGLADELAHRDDDRQQSGAGGSGSGESPSARYNPGRCGETDASHTHHSFWSGADWLGCRDGKFRPVESGAFPLVNGVPARVGRLRGYGNAIVPQVAAEFIGAFFDVTN